MPKALVIDDNRQMVENLCKILELFDVECIPAYGPRSAFMLIRSNKPDVVLLDIMMPGADGFEVLGYIRRLPEMENVPVIVITSDDQPETAQRVIENGGQMLIVKPPEIDKIESSLKKLGVL
jgi:CheY-like chemotaxis protein